MKAFGFGALASVGLAGFANAADLLPTTKPTPAPPKNCFASLWAYLDSTAADCPLKYGPFTVYATLDAGLMYNTKGAPWNAAYSNGTHGLISKQSNGPKWLWSPNNINQSVIGIKMSQPIADGWSLVGTLEAGFDPISGYLANSQRSQVMNNGKPLALQSANGDSSRAGQWDNSQFFLGFSNTTYGTLTGGRVNAISLDALIAYDPLGSAGAFSPFGSTGLYAGFGDTELSRCNTAIKYRGEFANFRVAGLAQIGGYNLGNGSSQMWQGQIGGDIHNLYAGTLSLDVVGSYAVDGVLTSPLSTPIPKFYSTRDLKATLSNDTGFLALAKYTRGPVQVFAGWEYFRQGNPSNDYPNGFKTIGGYDVPGNIVGAKAFPTVWITTDAFNIQRVYNTVWMGMKYAVNDRLDVAGAFYYDWQNNFSAKPCTGQGVHISSASCAGTADAFALLIDYRPVRRIDLCAGVAFFECLRRTRELLSTDPEHRPDGGRQKSRSSRPPPTPRPTLLRSPGLPQNSTRTPIVGAKLTWLR